MSLKKRGGTRTRNTYHELFPQRRTILRRPNSGICQFCLKIISASNWSRHLRFQHLKEIVRMKHNGGMEEEESPGPSEDEPAPSEPSQQSAEMGMMMEQQQQSGEQQQLEEEPTAMSIKGEESIGGDEQPNQMEDEDEEEEPEGEEEEEDADESSATSNDKKGGGGGRGKRRGRRPKSEGKGGSEKEKRKNKKKQTRILCAIKLPKDNVCPICGKTTSPGNWSRHLKRHHPEYARMDEHMAAMAMMGNQPATTDLFHHMINGNIPLSNGINNFAAIPPGVLPQEMDFSLVHLEQFLAQQKQHNDAFGALAEPAEPVATTENGTAVQQRNQAIQQPQQQNLMDVATLEVKLEKQYNNNNNVMSEENSRQNSIDEQPLKKMMRMAEEQEQRMMMMGMNGGGGVDERRMMEEQKATTSSLTTTATETTKVEGPVEGGESSNTTHTGGGKESMEPSTSSSGNPATGRPHRHHKSQRRVSTIRPNRDGRCPLCGKFISSPNWRRHLLRCHPEEEQLAQYKFPDPAFPIPVSTRLFALFAATAQLPLDHLHNEFLRKFLSLVPDFDIPSRRLLQAQMDGEVERLKQYLRSEIAAHNNKLLVAASIHINGGMVEGQMQQNWMAICAHFWSPAARGTESVGLSLGPVGYSNEDIVEAIRERLAEMELPLDRKKFINFTVDKCSVFSESTKPAFFDPFPTIGGGLHTVLAMLAFPVEWRLVDSSRELLELFFNGGDAEDDLGGVGEEEDNNGIIQFGQDDQLAVGVCASRRLQTVLRTVLERDPFMVQLRKRVFSVLGPFASSHLACSALFDRSGGHLPLFPANSRWCTLEPVYSRLLALSPVLNLVCAESKFPVLDEQDWKCIERVLEVSDTFHKFVAKLEQDSQPTISLLYPGLNLLLSTLQNFDQIPSLITSLVDHLQRAFADVLSPGHNSLFLCASMLDPKVAYLLVQERKQEGIAAIRQLVTRTVSDPTALVRLSQSSAESVDIVESPFGFGTVRRARVPVSAATAGTTRGESEERGDQIDQEIAEYLAVVQLDATESCAQFWIKHEQKFPLLAQTAKSVLTIPATSATARFFLAQVHNQQQSDASGWDIDSGVRKALLTFNRRFIDLAE